MKKRYYKINFNSKEVDVMTNPLVFPLFGNVFSAVCVMSPVEYEGRSYSITIQKPKFAINRHARCTGEPTYFIPVIYCFIHEYRKKKHWITGHQGKKLWSQRCAHIVVLPDGTSMDIDSMLESGIVAEQNLPLVISFILSSWKSETGGRQ